MKKNTSAVSFRKTLSRRSFLKSASLAIGTCRAWQSAFASPIGANGAVRIAIIGLGAKGSAHLKNLLNMPGVRISALCDVDPRVLEHAASSISGGHLAPFVTTDARRVFERNDVDAVMIATSNHWHALLTIWACQSGKDVYVEKPMSRTIWEGRKMIEAVRRYRRVVQVGTHYRSETGLAEAIQFLHSGQLGKIRQIRAIVYNLRVGIGRQHPWYPSWMDYSEYCGPAPMLPLERPRLHYDWHWNWNTGNGELGNNGVHVLDIALRMARHNTLPRQILSFGERFVIDDAAETPNTHVAIYDYAEIPLFFEHRALPARPGVNFMDQYGGIRMGIIAECEGGYVSGLVGATAFDLSHKRVKTFTGDGGAGHVKNFIDSVRSRRSEDLAAPVETGHLSASLCHYGNISYRVGAKVTHEHMVRAIAASPTALAIYDSQRKHLELHGVDLSRQPFRLGAWLEPDAANDGIRSIATERESGLDDARFLLRETQRPPYIIPEVV